MVATIVKYSLIFMVCLLVVSCSGGGEHGDLRDYIQEVKSRPAGNIESIPPFKPYEPFVYSAAANRSPFERPIEVQRRVVMASRSDVKPDLNRTKEYLEGFDLPTVKMVGNLKKEDILWALVSDPSGTIHWVKTGNFIGKNHGKIVETAENKIELIEIVSDGLDGWVERPRVIALSESEQ